MRYSSWARHTLLLLLLVVPFYFAGAEDIHKIQPTGYVIDLAGVLSPQTKARLEALCAELQQKADAQLAIVTVHSLEGQSVEEYAVDLFKQLGVGGKQSNRGVLLLISPDERKYRTEVGYDLEPVINDARAGDAGRSMVPFLRQRNYDAAIETAAWQLAKYVADDKGVTLSGRPPARAVQAGRNNSVGPVIFLIFLAVVGFSIVNFIFFVIKSVIHGGFGRGGPGGSNWWIGPASGGWGGGFGGGSSGWGGGDSGGGGFGGFGGGSSGGGGASGDW